MWSLSSERHHLNHGSWGAVPIPIQERQAEWRSRWESDTTAFILEEVPEALATARAALARFLGASTASLGFTRNATTAVASVVRSVEPWLDPGDEIVTTSHDYNAVRQTLEFTAARRGARVIVARVPFPLEEPGLVTKAVLDAVGSRTKVVAIDHITSPTGVIYPIADIVRELEPAIPVLIDGAHGPGQVPLDLDSLGASWYAGNLHKWVCAPKGSAFLHTRSDRVGDTYPVVISHGWNSPVARPSDRYHALFDWIGTDDVTSWLVLPDLLDLMESLEPGGWPALMARNRDLALTARDHLCQVLGVRAPIPEEMVGSMAALPLPEARGIDPGGMDSVLTRQLIDAGFEALVVHWPAWPHQVLRVSAFHYNTLDEYVALGEVLRQMVGESANLR